MEAKSKNGASLKTDDSDTEGDRQRRSLYKGGPVESVCGWNVFISGLHPTITGTHNFMSNR
jgi:hypothetical protein